MNASAIRVSSVIFAAAVMAAQAFLMHLGSVARVFFCRTVLVAKEPLTVLVPAAQHPKLWTYAESAEEAHRLSMHEASVVPVYQMRAGYAAIPDWTHLESAVAKIGAPKTLRSA